MMVRLSHEISHSWFGLIIGALDWTEEWLSEGFATYVEDHIHKRAMDILSKTCNPIGLPSSPTHNPAKVNIDVDIKLTKYLRLYLFC